MGYISSVLFSTNLNRYTFRFITPSLGCSTLLRTRHGIHLIVFRTICLYKQPVSLCFTLENFNNNLYFIRQCVQRNKYIIKYVLHKVSTFKHLKNYNKKSRYQIYWYLNVSNIHWQNKKYLLKNMFSCLVNCCEFTINFKKSGKLLYSFATM